MSPWHVLPPVRLREVNCLPLLFMKFHAPARISNQPGALLLHEQGQYILISNYFIVNRDFNEWRYMVRTKNVILLLFTTWWFHNARVSELVFIYHMHIFLNWLELCCWNYSPVNKTLSYLFQNTGNNQHHTVRINIHIHKFIKSIYRRFLLKIYVLVKLSRRLCARSA